MNRIQTAVTLLFVFLEGVVTGCLLLFLFTVSEPRQVSVDWHSHQPITCTEDMSCWDCETMGNRICGSSQER